MIGPNTIPAVKDQLTALLPEGITVRNLTNYGICLVADLAGVESSLDIIGLAAEAGGSVASATEGPTLVSIWHGHLDGVHIVARHEDPLPDFDDEDE